MTRLRILVADDHEITRKGIGSFLQARSEWEVCGEATNGREAVEKAAQLKPDVVILDIVMPQLNGLDATRRILHCDPRVKILILTMHDSEQIVREVVEAGARGCVLKSDAGRDLTVAIDALQRNKTFFTSKVSPAVLERIQRGGNRRGAGKEILTIREREVVQLLAEGKSTKEVAVSLGLSVKTAETHRSNIMRKLDIHSISELVLYAVRNNIVPIVQPALPKAEEA